MKKYFFMMRVLCALVFSGVSIYSYADTPTLTVDNHPYDIFFNTCGSIRHLDFEFGQINGSYEGASNNDPDYIFTYRYHISLYCSGTLVNSVEFHTGDDALDCIPGQGCPGLDYVFADINPSTGSYYATIIVDRYIGGQFNATVTNMTTNTIHVTRPDNGFPTCTGVDYTNSFAPCPNKTKIYQFVSGEYFVVQQNTGLVYKFSNLGSTGTNMWNISSAPPANQSGGSNLLGYHSFNTAITDMLYTPDGKTIISFADGKILKLNGTGGNGANMFAVTETSSSFTTISPYTYYVGDDKFSTAITDLCFKDGKLFVSCVNGNMLKVNNSGGNGHSMFAVTETSTGFTNIAPYTYYSGSSHFASPIVGVYDIGTNMFIALSSAKLLKINNTGGTGDNMFAVNETAGGFTNISPYTHYSGDYKFLSAVNNMYNNAGYTFVTFNDGRILKINGVGGTGYNMFAITETSTSFSTVAGSTFYVGDAYCTSPVTIMTHNATDTRMFIGFANGLMMKVINNGSTGHNMFNMTQTAHGFSIANTSLSTQMEGSIDFNSKVTEIKFFGTSQIICLENNKILKINGDGGTGYNMYSVSQEDPQGFRPLYGNTQYLIGSQRLGCSMTQKSAVAQSETNSSVNETLSQEIEVKTIPNPFNDRLSIQLPEGLQNNSVSIELLDINGQLKLKCAGDRSQDLETEFLQSGLYILLVKENGIAIQTSKVVKY